jgi:hypothetical protein
MMLSSQFRLSKSLKLAVFRAGDRSREGLKIVLKVYTSIKLIIYSFMDEKILMKRILDLICWQSNLAI